MKVRMTAIVAFVLLVAGLLGGAALAQDAPALTYQADLETLNDSGATGTATLSLDGTALTVEIQASGLTPGLAHAQHIHGALDGVNVCPPPSADTNEDGYISTPEGVPFYGGINVSLTTEGDTGPESGLALPRFPVADGNGDISYSRTIEVSQDVADSLTSLVIVQHGIDLDNSGEYDGDASPLDPSVPFEATIPADCGEINLAQVGDQSVARLAGATRIETAVEISQKQFPEGSEEVYLARSDVLADAVASGALTDGPVLLVPSCGELPEVVAEEVARLSPTTVYALGGDLAICDDIVIQAAQASLGAATG